MRGCCWLSWGASNKPTWRTTRVAVRPTGRASRPGTPRCAPGRPCGSRSSSTSSPSWHCRSCRQTRADEVRRELRGSDESKISRPCRAQSRSEGNTKGGRDAPQAKVAKRKLYTILCGLTGAHGKLHWRGEHVSRQRTFGTRVRAAFEACRAGSRVLGELQWVCCAVNTRSQASRGGSDARSGKARRRKGVGGAREAGLEAGEGGEGATRTSCRGERARWKEPLRGGDL